ncbi:AAA family ATPase (plasmid) [Pectobacterium sp. PL64]|uniref:AAA family ATPase n=1 Tax=Pectobacterium sp. PL64 TaxID=2738983 RepID=UPI001F0CDB86|nr:ATP-binding protein [Pectobacterium sp. PL64]UMO90295.1 AAA family ATPase [Pectobacterium sp. PL64]
MLERFEVAGFRGFEDKFSLDLAQKRNYEFNDEAINNGVVKTSVIYGKNGSGKSNLTHAIFDLISHLSEASKLPSFFSRNYLNAKNKSGVASFKYCFRFLNDEVVYFYDKKNARSIVMEGLDINGVNFVYLNRKESSVATINIPGTENLNKDFSGADDNVSIISYINNNSVFPDGDITGTFKKFISYVKGMLFFRSLLEGNSFIGLESSGKSICQDIVEHDNIKDFENFLNSNGVECKLKEIEGDNGKNIGFDFGDVVIPFYEIASTGTKSLGLFFFWMQRIEQVSLICIDEFDAFYHHELSANLVSILRDSKAQVILTTHNTSIMSNEILRPDCYFVMDKKNISPLNELTDKEIRVAHNLEKIYKAGGFNKVNKA